MKIAEDFVKEILEADYPSNYQDIYDKNKLLQYLDKKMKSVHGNSRTRRSLANIYAIYSILFFYKDDFYNEPASYKKFHGYDYMKLFNFYRSLYGGSKLQNHALNSRVNGEFSNKFLSKTNDLIIANYGKYLIHIDYLYTDKKDISKTACKIIERYIELLIKKDHALIRILDSLMKSKNAKEKKKQLTELLSEDSEARIFEIISYAILKNHYKNTHVYFGYTRESIRKYELELYKTGRTNANDGGIDFVMRPIGRFFQVTEVNNYDKYLLDIDKVVRFPVTFVIKTVKTKTSVMDELHAYITEQSAGMEVIEERYKKAVEEIITIKENALKAYDKFMETFGAKYEKAVENLEKDKEDLFRFYDYPAEHWTHIRTSNPIESTFATVRLRHNSTKGNGTAKATVAMAFKLCQQAEKKWRRLKGFEKLDLVAKNIEFENGVLKVAA